jgi:hypothetical protein
VYSIYAIVHATTYACYYIFSPNKLRLIERESTILSSVFSNRAFNPRTATGIPVSTESLVLEGTQKRDFLGSNFEFLYYFIVSYA